MTAKLSMRRMSALCFAAAVCVAFASIHAHAKRDPTLQMLQRIRRMRSPLTMTLPGMTEPIADSDIPQPTRKLWFDQPNDHFDFSAEASALWKQQVLVYDGYVPATTTHAKLVFFYCGNEGGIGAFWNNTGWQFVLAKQLGALVIFAEHRYYGDSFPDKDYTYLSSEQALGDYVHLLESLRGSMFAERAKIIAFGGSYGGMLAYGARRLYPATFHGAIASSAPIMLFTGLGRSPYAFDQVVAADFKAAGLGCHDTLRDSMLTLNTHTWTPSELADLSSTLALCTPLETASAVPNQLLDLVESILTYSAMVDYPYATSFLIPLPPNPVNAVCAAVSAATPSDSGSARGALHGSPAPLNVAGAAVRAAFDVWFNTTGNKKCYSLGSPTPSLGLGGWDYQSCTEMVLPSGSDGAFMPTAPWNLTQYTTMCQEELNLTPRPRHYATIYGPTDATNLDNIAFPNGALDPWQVGGILRSSPMQGAAHHLDLRTPNQADPQSVSDRRQNERAEIMRWIS